MRRLETSTRFNAAFLKALPYLIFVIGIWFFNIRLLGNGFEYIPGDLGDSRFINYLLEHGHQWIFGEEPSFWNARFMYPYENTIAISDNMIGTLPIYSFWRVIGLDQETAYQLWWISISALNYWITFLILLRWVKRPDLAILGAFLFAFSIYNVDQLNYMQMNVRFMVPVVIYAATKMVDTGSYKYLTWFIAGIVIQFYSVIYTGFFLAYFSIGYIIVYAFFTKQSGFIKRLLLRKNLKYTLPIFLAGIALVITLMLPYWNTSKELGLRLFDEVKWNIPMFSAYLFPPDSSIWSFLHETMKPNTEAWWLQSVFIGLIPLLFLFTIPILWIYWRVKKIQPDKLTLSLSVVIIIIALLFIRLGNGWTLYATIFKLPGMNSMRVLNRFMHVEFFFIVLFIILLLKKASHLAIFGFLALIFVDNYFDPSIVTKTTKQECQLHRKTLTDVVMKDYNSGKHKAFAIVRPNAPHYLGHLDAMMASLYTNIPTVNAYSSGCPDDFGEFFNHSNMSGLEEWLKNRNVSKEDILIIEIAN